MKLCLTAAMFFVLSIAATAAFPNELADRKEIANTVKMLFMDERFHELDSIAEHYRTSEERTSSGLLKLTLFYYGFNKFASSDEEDEEYWNLIKRKVNKWLEENPRSPAAHIVKGIILRCYAWKFRGDGWARDVPKEAWKPFKENLAIAHVYMLESKKIASVDPHWYEVVAHIKNALGEDSESYKAFVDEGLKKFPRYYQLYFAAIDYLAPKWHGSKEEIERFANDAVARTKEREGMGLYARIYWYASQTQYDERLFTESDVVWEKMRDGIFDVVEAYPDSWNIQNFAYFSCLAKDKNTTRILFDRMVKPILMPAWKKKENYLYCRDFAFSSKQAWSD